MSDLDLLSHQYQMMAGLARRLRYQVLQIKRLYYGLPEGRGDKEIDIDASASIVAFQRILLFLSQVVPLGEEDAWPEDWLYDPPLPIAIVERLRKTHTLNRPLYVQSLTKAEQRLSQGIPDLKERDILLLEEIAQSASADANAVFRRLMRWA